MEDMIKTGTTTEEKQDRFDLFSSLLDANFGALDGMSKLSDSELIGLCIRIPQLRQCVYFYPMQEISLSFSLLVSPSLAVFVLIQSDNHRSNAGHEVRGHVRL